jgi:hypothetical protein
MATLKDQAAQILHSIHQEKEVAVIGLHSTANLANPDGGRIAIMGDSSCFDSTSKGADCLWLIRDLLEYTNSLTFPTPLQRLSLEVAVHQSPLPQLIPQRLAPDESSEGFTRLPSGPIQCSFQLFRDPVNLRGNPIDVVWQVRL